MSSVVSLCQDLVKFKTDNNNLHESLVFIKKYLDALGFTAEIVRVKSSQGVEVDNLYAKYGQGSPHLLFVGHMDVVPAGDNWQHPPYEAEVDNGILYGRGISDMKGGIGCFMDAVKEFVNEQKFSGAISFIISGDEEEPIVEGVKKLLEIRADKGEKFDFSIVGEPSNPSYLGEEIKIGRRGDAVLKIISRGIQGHTAFPDAVNPVHHLIDLLHNMKKDTLDNGTEEFWPSSFQITTFDVGNPASNIVPPVAKATIDIRFNSLHSISSLTQWAEKHIQATHGDFSLEVEAIGESFLSHADENVQKLKDSVFEVTGNNAKYFTSGGLSDARFVRDYCNVVEFGLTNKTIHKKDECASVDDINNLQKVYKTFLKKFFA